MDTRGWTIDEWLARQRAGTAEQAEARIVDLVSTFEPALPVWIHVCSSEEISRQFANLKPELPLYGVPFAVKDNIDVAGLPTTAACPAFKFIAASDAFIVAKLRALGAIVVGKTNMDQFATGLVGTRSPYGAPSSVFSKDHISGGSSSGSAVAVGSGLVPFSLGTDTAGSGRVPAALNNLIGLKPTVGVWSPSGVVPACRSLDTASVFTLTLDDAQLVFDACAQYDQSSAYTRPFPAAPKRSFGKRPIFGVPSELKFYGDDDNAALFEAAIQRVRDAGIEIMRVDCTDLFDLAKLLYEGPWVAERLHAVQDYVDQPDKMDPTVWKIAKSAEGISAVDAFDAEYKRQEICKRVRENLLSYLDGFIMPTCPLNPTHADIAREPILVNSQQGTYTNFVNLGDFAALAVPSGFRPDGLPQGITFIGEAFTDFALLDVAKRYLNTGKRLLGNTGRYILDNPLSGLENRQESLPLAVVGAHLSGMPLNWQLRSVGASLKGAALTAPKYRLHALNTVPAKPGLRRSESDGVALAVEVWDIPRANFADFISFVPAPLGIGRVELADGTYVHGFICEGSALETAPDVSEFGGWKNYIASTAPSSSPPFVKVLVANRGEIAVRIIRTLKRLGIKSVAVYSQPDKDAQHVRDADESIDLHGTTAAETYLSIRKIVDACKKTGAQAVIPGYGFLSENADFSDALEAEGIVFVGPSGSAIRQLGLKHSARELAEKAGVPLVPGSGLVATVDEALGIAEKLGYPIMIKSTAGGGGIGLQCVHTREELPTAFTSVQRQGLSYFGDAGVFLECFVENARHVEVQVFGDGRGDAVAIGERDCSLQRRNQKIIEETPAPGIDEATRAAMRKSGRDLIASMNYKCAATVEYIYDSARNSYYFLEVNARLQVEHPITESVTGLDLVEWMLYTAADRPPDFAHPPEVKGWSMEARLYAENPVRDFLPSPGQITEITFPTWARIDGWAQKGTIVSSEYDPTLAKIIVHGDDRDDCLAKLVKALDETFVAGVVTNLDYLRSVARSEMFTQAKMFTKALDSYAYNPHAVEVVAPGASTTIQDYPGRALLWHVGVPPSGPMDSYAHRAANHVVGNHEHAPALEITLKGPTLLFHHDSIISVTGGKAEVLVDNKAVPMWKPVEVKAGQEVAVGKLITGCRAYLAIRGGLDVPEYLGSRSTFAQGELGGHNGRVLKFGDVIALGQTYLPSCQLPAPISEPISFPTENIPEYTNAWQVAVTTGPHGAPDFFKPEFLEVFFSHPWKVHYNSNRFGVRLMGPKPEWARPDGGEAGLHPSNAHDYVYSLGAVNFTGDEPVILACDGPSLGGFVCACVIVEADLWKVGQFKPGDTVQFSPISTETAGLLRAAVDSRLSGKIVELPAFTEDTTDPVLFSQASTPTSPKVAYRQAGDRYLLIEYGDNLMDLNLRYRVHQLEQAVLGKVPGVLEMSAGVRSVHLEYEPRTISQAELMKKLVSIEVTLSTATDWKVPSRIIRLPMAFEDKLTLSAVSRYQETIRKDAPWLPNNVDFIRDVNDLSDRNDVRDLMYTAKFMVLGLGDVYLGAPCAVPLDPRQRLLGTKYNPSRSWTPNGTVGLGGMYMCIYTMESPGGYQLIGRTIPIWDKLCLNEYTKDGKPWLLAPFDQVEFYPVSEAALELDVARVEQGVYEIEIEAAVFDNAEYEGFLAANAESIDAHRTKLAGLMDEFSEIIANSNRELDGAAAVGLDTGKFSDTAELVYAEITGRFWKPVVEEGARVNKGDPIVILEAMKTEMIVAASAAGVVAKIVHRNGDMVETGDVVAVIEPET